ncbi:MAG: hypothetical protein ABI723_16175 [Bacteroidia bacterium]
MIVLFSTVSWIILIAAVICFLYVLRLFFQWLLSETITVKEKFAGIIAQTFVFILVQIALPKLTQKPYSTDGWSSFDLVTPLLQTMLYMINIIVWGLFLRSRKLEFKKNNSTSN